MPLDTEVSLSAGDVVLDRDPAPPVKGEGAQLPSPKFSAHVYCDQTAGWIKMPLCTEVGLGPGHIVKWGPTSLQKGHSPQFSAHVCVAKRSPISATAEHL